MSCGTWASRPVPRRLTLATCCGDSDTPPQPSFGAEREGKLPAAPAGLLPRRARARGRGGDEPGRGGCPAEGRAGRVGLRPPHPAFAERMASDSGRWSWVLWRACNGLMAAFFALAAVVQVRARPPRRAVGKGPAGTTGARPPAPSPAGEQWRPASRQGRRGGYCRWRTGIGWCFWNPHLLPTRDTGVFLGPPHPLFASKARRIWFIVCYLERDLSRSSLGTFINILPADETEHSSGSRPEIRTKPFIAQLGFQVHFRPPSR